MLELDIALWLPGSTTLSSVREQSFGDPLQAGEAAEAAPEKAKAPKAQARTAAVRRRRLSVIRSVSPHSQIAALI